MKPPHRPLAHHGAHRTYNWGLRGLVGGGRGLSSRSACSQVAFCRGGAGDSAATANRHAGPGGPTHFSIHTNTNTHQPVGQLTPQQWLLCGREGRWSRGLESAGGRRHARLRDWAPRRCYLCVCVHEGVGVACGLVGGGAPKSIAVSVPPAVYTSNPSRLATKLAL